MKAFWFKQNTERILEEVRHLHTVSVKWLELPEEDRKAFLKELALTEIKLVQAKEILEKDNRTDEQ